MWLSNKSIVLVFGMTVVGCDNGSTSVLTAEQQEIKTAMLAGWAELPADEKAAIGNALRIVGLPSNPQSWSNSNWVKFFGLSEQDSWLMQFVDEATWYWNAGGGDREDVEEFMAHLKGSPHNISSSISNNPNNWTKAQAEIIYAAWEACDCYYF